MSDIERKREQIELKINDWKEDGSIIDFLEERSPNGDTVFKNIQHSGRPFTVYFNAQACKVGYDNSDKQPEQFKWEQDNVVEKVLSYIEQLLSI